MADFADTTTGYVFELQTGVAGPAFEPFAAAVGGYKNILAKISDATSLDPESLEWKAAFLSVAHTPVFDDGSSGIELTAGAGVMIIRTLLDVQTKDSEVVVCSFSGQSAPQKLATFALRLEKGHCSLRPC